MIIAEGDVRDGAEEETPAVELFDGPLFSLAQDLRVREDWPEDVALRSLPPSSAWYRRAG